MIELTERSNQVKFGNLEKKPVSNQVNWLSEKFKDAKFESQFKSPLST